jgi:hypothetical protein
MAPNVSANKMPVTPSAQGVWRNLVADALSVADSNGAEGPPIGVVRVVVLAGPTEGATGPVPCR